MNIKNIFSKNNKNDASAPKKVRNKGAWKHGGYAIALTAIILAVAVGVNVLFTALSKRVNLDLDISLSGANTLDAENIEFLQGIDREVTVTVCFTEADYTNGGYAYIAQNYNNAVDSTGTYFAQTISLLKKYPVYSDNIKVKFVDPYDPSFTAVIADYSTTNIMAGDIIVEATHMVDGKEVKRSDILTFDDIYTLYDETGGYAAMGYGQYTVTENKLETALTSAIYKVTSAETKQVTVIGAHSAPDTISGYTSLLQMNNFEVTVQDTNVVVELDKDTDLVIIAAPYEDFLAQELELIDEWLYNSAQRGRGLIFFASPTSPKLPTLDNYLAEWGIAYDDGVLFETQAGMYVAGDPTTMAFLAEKELENEAAKNLAGKVSVMVAAGGNRPMRTLFDTEGLRSTHVIVASSEGVVKAPLGVKSDWTPDSSYTRASNPGMILAIEETYEDNILRTSYVAAFSSYNFAAEDWLSTYSYNTELLLSTARTLSGAEDEGFSFTSKKQETNSFKNAVTEDQSNAISIIFQWALPLALIATGVAVFVRRRRR